MATLSMNFLSKALGMQTTVNIIIPTYSFADTQTGSHGDYYEEGMKYQVLWLLHGFSGDQDDYIKFSNIVRYAEEHKLVVVMPAAYNMAYTDMNPGVKYASYITEELPKMIQAYFPVSSKREDNFIAGLSMGGAGTMKIALAHPEKYSYAYCMSGAAGEVTGEGYRYINWFGDGKAVYNGGLPDNLPELKETEFDAFYMAKKNVEEGKELPIFTITVGDKDFAVTKCEEAYHYLKDLGYDVTYDLVPGYAHEWDFWDLQLRKATSEVLPLKNAPMYKE